MKQTLAAKVLNTLAYNLQFHHPLTLSEIHRFLITSESVSLAEVKSVVNKMVVQGIVFTSNTMYSLDPNIDKEVKKRQYQTQSSRNLLKAHSTSLNTIKSIPTVRAVCITGSVAVESASEQDDIDLMIITTPGTLWLTRLFVTGYLELTGHRRRPKTNNPAGLLCANLYIDAAHLTVPPVLRNLYTARELAQVLPLIDPSHQYDLQLIKNAWIKNYLANVPIPPRVSLTVPLAVKILLPLEIIAYLVQTLYMAPRRTRELISLHYAYFHPRNTSKGILSRYEAVRKKYNLLQSTP